MVMPVYGQTPVHTGVNTSHLAFIRSNTDVHQLERDWGCCTLDQHRNLAWLDNGSFCWRHHANNDRCMLVLNKTIFYQELLLRFEPETCFLAHAAPFAKGDRRKSFVIFIVRNEVNANHASIASSPTLPLCPRAACPWCPSVRQSPSLRF